MPRKNLSKALDFSRSVLPLNDLVSTVNATQEDVFLVLDTNEIQALAQPKQISLSGVSNSLAQLPAFQQSVSGIVQQSFRQLNFAYGSFYDTSRQVSSGTTSKNYMRCNTVSLTSDGITIASGTCFIVPVSGTYNVQFSAQFEKSDAGNTDVDVWFVKNNVDLPWSDTQFTLTGNNGHGVAAWNYFLTGAPGDNFQIAWSSTSASVVVAAYSGLTNPTRPDIPSVIVTFNQIA
jgi:hypothetical protein